MTNDRVLSNTISILRLPLTVGVVFIHFTMKDGFNYHGVVYGLDNPPFFFFVVNLFSEVLARVCVPLFFIISGFLFFFHFNLNKESYIKKLKNRVKTLFLPFFLWNIIAAIIILGKSALPFYPDVKIVFSFSRLFNTLFYNSDGNGIIVGPSFLVPSMASPLDIPLWFVRDLMVMVLLAPAHYWLIKITQGAYVVLLGLLCFFSPLYLSSSGYVGTLIMTSFFFSRGIFCSVRKVKIILFLRRFKFFPIVYVIVAIVDALSKDLGFNEHLHKIGILFGVVSYVIFVFYLAEKTKVKVNRSLSASTFFIFSFHTLFMGDIGKIVFRLCKLPGDNSFIMLMIYFLVPIIVVIICYSLYVLLDIFALRLCGLLVGNRC